MNQPVYIRLGKDMNGSMKQRSVFQREYYGNVYYSVEPDIYKLAYRHVVDVMKKEGATNIKFVWSPSVESIPNISFNDLTRYYPGDEYVDWINLSGYNIDGEGEVDPILWNQMIKAKTRTFDEIFGDVYNELRRMYPDKPMMIETSSLNRDNSKQAYIHSLFDHLSDYPNIQIATWYEARNAFLWDDLSDDSGKNEFNITLPRTTDEYVSNMLNDTSKFVTNPN